LRTHVVVVSNGFSKFHLAVAAAEAYRRGLLSLLLTGAYPTRTIKRFAARSARFGDNRKIARLIARGERIPSSLVRALWTAEAVHHAAMATCETPGLKQIAALLNLSSCRLYARIASQQLSIMATKTRVYHYRAGFGLDSVAHAKKLGMVTLCDHSIAHPGVLSYLAETHGQMPPGRREPSDAFWSRVLSDIDQADAVLVNSEFVRQTFLHQGYDARRIHLAYLGVDDQFMRAIPLRDESLPPSGPLRMLFAGSLQRRKGADALLTALTTLDDFAWRIEIAGPIDIDIARRYQGILADSRVTLLGILPRTELAKRMAEAEVFVFPSLVEGSARVVFEALAAGCYVITARNTGSIVRDSVHGSLVPPDDAGALAKAIGHAQRIRSSLAAIGKRNAQLISSSYRQRHYGDALEKLYLELANASRGCGVSAYAAQQLSVE
jgi:glycosyltransferase involved in cell wall biosynthesis